MKVNPVQHIRAYERQQANHLLAVFESERDYTCPCLRLAYCQAYTIETEHIIALRSYNTIVALFDKETKTLFDILRVEYGYTATSAQHIAKFRNQLRYRFPFSIIKERRVLPE